MTQQQSSTTEKKIAFFGTPDFTTEFLDVLVAAGYAPSLIITNPDRPVGRGQVLTSPAPKIWAQEKANESQKNIRVLQPESIDDAFIEALAKESWDLFIVIAYGKILPEKLIAPPKHGTINLHYSLLPKYRGATPVESAILHGDVETGITIQQMAYALDSGDIITQIQIPIMQDDTTLTLRKRLNTEAQKILPETLTTIFDGTATRRAQDDTLATRCKKNSKADGLVSLSDDPITLDRKFRAYTPWPGIYFTTTHREKTLTVKITAAHYDPTTNAFIIDEVIPENHKRMSYDAFQQFIAS